MNVIRAIRRPQYILRPGQILKRLTHFRHAARDEVDTFLPWGLLIRLCPHEALGRAICTLGLDDLPVCEVLWRLVPSGGTVVDVGANIGQMTSIMALRAGGQGTVFALEPELRNLALLRHNVRTWAAAGRMAKIVVVDKAAADVEGEASLFLPAGMARNRGIASLHRPAGEAGQQRVRTAPLSKILHGVKQVDLLKIDAEGAEDAVVPGYAQEIAAGRVTHIVAEEHRPFPSPLSARLEELGYRCFMVAESFSGPALKPIDPETARPADQPVSILATRDAASAGRAVSRPGWQCLSNVPLRDGNARDGDMGQ